MGNEQLVARLSERFGDNITVLNLNPAQAAVSIETSALVDFVKFIREDEITGIDYLSCITAVDLLDGGMELIYSFSSCRHHHKLTVKVKLNREKPEVPTILTIFPGADWHEREAWELFGINIAGHPNLKTLLLPETWDQGWPMRRDWPGGKDFIKLPEL